MKKHLLFIAALIFAIAGCKIDTAGLPQAQKNPLLIGQWYLKSTSSTDPSSGITDVYSAYTAKDFYTFNNDNTLQYSSSSPDTVFKSRYSYTDVSSIEKVIIGAAPDFSTYTINKLTADSLIMSTIFTASVSITGSVSGGGTTVTGSNSADLSVPVIYKFARK